MILSVAAASSSSHHQEERSTKPIAPAFLMERIDSTQSLSCSSSSFSLNDDAETPYKRRRVVQFASTVQIVSLVPARDDYTDSEKSELYWMAPDIQTIRTRAKLQTLEIRKHQQETIFSTVDRVYTSAQQLAQTAITESDVQGVLNSPWVTDHAQTFRPWCLEAAAGRGLERYVSSKHRADRTNNTAQARRVVVELSQAGQASPLEISTAYRLYTRPALIFARIAGEADAMVARDETKNEKYGETPRSPQHRSKQLRMTRAISRPAISVVSPPSSSLSTLDPVSSSAAPSGQSQMDLHPQQLLQPSQTLPLMSPRRKLLASAAAATASRFLNNNSPSVASSSTVTIKNHHRLPSAAQPRMYAQEHAQNFDTSF